MSTTKFIKLIHFFCIGWMTVIFLSACGGGGSSSEIKSVVNEPIAVAILNVAPIKICPSGGITVQSGVDANANQILELTEASSTQYVCNGSNGLNGSNGTNGVSSTSLNALLLITSEPQGIHCLTGGSLVSVGLDTNSNNILDGSEVTSSNYICNGTDGSRGNNGSTGQNGLNSLVAITAVPSGVNCLFGGSKATSGLDTNANNVLDSSEITSTTFICTGATGATGATGVGTSAYAYIYNLGEQTIEVKKEGQFDKSAVLFDSNGVLNGVEHELGSDQIFIASHGYYFVSFSISGTEPNQFAIFVKADSSTRCNKDEPGDGWLRMSRHHGHSNRQVQVARCTSTSAEKNDTKFTAS